jgi:hypothetical protein
MVFKALWLNLYAEGTIAGLSVFAIGYVASTIIAFIGCSVTL